MFATVNNSLEKLTNSGVRLLFFFFIIFNFRTSAEYAILC